MIAHTTSPVPDADDQRPSFNVQFIDNREPAVLAGTYRIGVSETIDSINTGDYLSEHTQDFRVSAPQFRLPDGTVRAVNPQPQQSSDLSQTLAHVTLDDALLAWRRQVDSVLRGQALTPLAARVPWLALLLFTEDELLNDPTAEGTTVAVPVRELTAANPPANLWQPKISENQLEDEEKDALAATVRMPGHVFTALVPRTEELRHLAHVRSVTVDSRLRGEELSQGEFTVITTNRLPDADQTRRYVAHLVSLEGCRHILQAADDNQLTDQDEVRLATLHTWSFTSAPAAGGGFYGRIRNIAFDEDDRPRDLLLRVTPAAPTAAGTRPAPDTNEAPASPPHAGDGHDSDHRAADHDGVHNEETPPSSPRPAPPAATRPAPQAETAVGQARTEVTDRLNAGWVALRHQLETGQATTAWYRGPFTAAPAQPLTGRPADGWSTATELLAYLPAWGMFDATYANAFSLGRALALADTEFSAALSHWHQRARFRTAALAQRETGPLAAVLTAEQDSLRRPHCDALIRAVREAVDSALIPTLLSAPVTIERTTTAPHSGSRDRARTHDISAYLTQPPSHVQQMLDTVLAPLAEPVTDWLDRLTLLYPVPFAHLVPDERALPAESMRLFYLDANWLTCLRDGAQSVITDESSRALARLAPWTRTAPPAPAAGVLLRSQLVHEVPGLLVRGYDAAGRSLSILRYEALAPDMLMVLFDEVPQVVEVAEPPEGLSFGIDFAMISTADTASNVPVLNLRSLSGNEAGKELDVVFPSPTGQDGLTRHLRADPTGARRILDLRPSDPQALLEKLRQALRTAGEPMADGMGPAGLALQLVNTARRQYFRPAAFTAANPDPVG
ncbi:hypothetical protein ABT160_42875 [Streptomyces sp. NPDC001941]|uniref:hypothetical protein n=1 Tax=Streptomyces sp. NPDC001941 TaxID=3154659 RepID=UPI003332E27F